MFGGESALRQEEGNKEACGHKRGANDENLVQGVAKGVENTPRVVVLLLAQLLLGTCASWSRQLGHAFGCALADGVALAVDTQQSIGIELAIELPSGLWRAAQRLDVGNLIDIAKAV